MKKTLSTVLVTLLCSSAAFAVCPLKYGKSMNRYAASSQRSNYYTKATSFKAAPAKAQANGLNKVRAHK